MAGGGSAKESAKDGAKGNARQREGGREGPRMFPSRRPASEEDVRSARAQSSRVIALAREGVSPAQIARLARLKTAAVEEVLADPPPAPNPVVTPFAPRPPTEPSWAMAGSGADLSAPPIPSVYDTLDESMRSVGIQSGPRQYVVRRFGRYPADDYQSLLEILSALSLPTGVAKAVVDDYREQSEGPTMRRTTGPAHPETPADRRRREREERRQERLDELDARREAAEVQILERQARGESAPGAISDRERGLMDQLKEAQERTKSLEQAEAIRQAVRSTFESQVVPLRDEIKSLRESTRAPTPAETDAQSYARAAALQSSAQTALMNEGVAVLRERPKIGHDIAGVVRNVGVPAVGETAKKWIQTVATPEERASVGVPPTEAEMALQAAQLEAVESAERIAAGAALTPDGRPRATIPRRRPTVAEGGVPDDQIVVG
jgi:hypothetical protein